MEFDRVSRRRFLSTAAGAAAALAMARTGVAFGQDAVLDIPRSNNRAGYEKVLWKVEPFPMTQVRFREGPLNNAMEINGRYLASVPNDRLLHMFRVTAGLPSTAEPLGGWEAPDCELRGHFAGGHYLSGCALMYASTLARNCGSSGNRLRPCIGVPARTRGWLSSSSVPKYRPSLRSGVPDVSSPPTGK